VYPQNLIEPNEYEDSHSVKFIPKKAHSKIPFPPMTIGELKRLVNLRQKPSNKLIKNAILLSDKPNEAKDKYKNIIKENKI
jgi:hypothetical protein